MTSQGGISADFDNTRSVVSCEEGFVRTLADVLAHGDEVSLGSSKSIGAGRTSRELMNYMITIDDPRARVFSGDRYPLRMPLAIGRFVWLMSGSDRLSHIAVYDEGVRRFSDDGVSVPGSNFGQRILKPRPGVNQLANAIELLRCDPTTRRAAISIYAPEDCGRDSRDIPCALAISYQVRGGHLHATTLMRSNNAWGLLPYNLFEFSLLAEVIAVEVGVPLGTLTHFAISMHIYEKDIESTEQLLLTVEGDGFSPSATLGIIPKESAPLRQVAALVGLESALRYEATSLNAENASELIEQASGQLDDYWFQFYLVLLWHFVTRRGLIELANAVRKRMRPDVQLAMPSVG